MKLLRINKVMQLGGLWLILSSWSAMSLALTTAAAPMNRKAHQAAWVAGNYAAILDDLTAFKARGAEPSQAILLYLGSQLGVTTYKLDDIIAALKAKIATSSGASASGASAPALPAPQPAPALPAPQPAPVHQPAPASQAVQALPAPVTGTGGGGDGSSVGGDSSRARTGSADSTGGASVTSDGSGTGSAVSAKESVGSAVSVVDSNPQARVEAVRQKDDGSTAAWIGGAPTLQEDYGSVDARAEKLQQLWAKWHQQKNKLDQALKVKAENPGILGWYARRDADTDIEFLTSHAKKRKNGTYGVTNVWTVEQELRDLLGSEIDFDTARLEQEALRQSKQAS